MSDLGEAAARARELLPAPGWVTARRCRQVVAPIGALRETFTLEVVLLREGRLGRGKVEGPFPEEAVRAAELGLAEGPDIDHPGPVAPAPPRPHDGFDAATAAAGPEILAGLLDGHRGSLFVNTEWVALATTAGDFVAEDAVTSVRGGVSVGDGSASGAAVGLDGLDIARVAARAAARDTDGAEQIAVPPGVPVVLAPEAAGDLLAALAFAFSGLLYARDEGPLAGRLGTRVAASAINLSDSPRYPGTLARAFDAEGVPKAPLPLIQDGVAHRVVHDGRSAALAGTTSSGHAFSPGGFPGEPVPRNLVLVGGGAEDEDALVAGVEHGIFVARLGSGEGLSRELLGAREIRDGHLAAPLAPVRLAEPCGLDVLTRVQALSARPRLVVSGRTAVMAPAVRLSGIMLA